ncbi:MAG TPA: hypothetical protein VFG79_05030, partial [Solirubrobacter sp.]|nr:hypothetical protein [Solirubrobacter sp.]
ERIYDDYSDDGKIDVCDHERADLQETLDSIEAGFDTDFPDFREAVRAGIQRHDRGRCEDDSSSSDDDDDAGGGAAPTATPSPAATTAPPASTPESGTLPDESASGEGPVQPESGTLPPETGAAPEPTVSPAATPPVSVTPAASAAPVIVSRSGGGGLLLPGILLAFALLCGAALAAFAVGARRSPRLRHAWREASLRTRGTWSDFSDWLRLGR